MFGDGVLDQFGPGGNENPMDAIRSGASKNMTDMEFIATEVVKWLQSRRREWQQKGQRYYDYEQDITDPHAYTTDADGAPVITDNRRSNPVIDNQYANMVDQKVNYILGKRLSIQTGNDRYTDALNLVFDKDFHRMMQGVAIDAYNGGIAWVHPYYTEQGEMAFKHFPAQSIFPFWADDAHTQLDMAIRYYETIAYVDKTARKVQHIEVFSKTGIQRYILENGRMTPDGDMSEVAYAVDTDGNKLAWERIPLVAFKYNQHEIPLIKRAITLQDAINNTRSNWDINMNEDIRDTILVLRNYDGTSLDEFRQKLIKYGAVKVADGGDVSTLRIERDATNYAEYLKETKRALIENARGFDAKDDRMGNNPNEMNLRSMYSDIDLDADMLETQFQAAFDQLLWFVNQYLATAGQGDFSKEEVAITFNRNMIVNDTETITNIKNSVGIVSTETLLAHHPYVTNAQDEQDRLDKENHEDVSQAGGYPQMGVAAKDGGGTE